MSKPQPVFRPSQVIPQSGLYCVHHVRHRASHEVTLLRDEKFPECNKCGSEVTFELVRAIPGLEESDFHVRLFVIPHPEPDGEAA